MSVDSEFTEIERLLLIAGLVNDMGPEASLGHANTAVVVRQALSWSGLADEVVRRAWNGLECDHPIIARVYEELIRMVRGERPGERLFEGGGNWGKAGKPRRPPAGLFFNSCRLTVFGEQCAHELLELYPQYRKEL